MAVTIPYTFSNGTQNADATQVNANFNALATVLNTDVILRDATVAFTAIPYLPATTPTDANHATRKGYVDGKFPIVTAQITDANVTTAKLADGAVATAKVADAGVTTAKLADGAVTTLKITDANVTTAKVADSAVTTAKLADASVTNVKLVAGLFRGVSGIQNGYCGKAYASAVQSIPNNTATAVLLGAEYFDYANMHDVATNTARVTVTVAGVYDFSALVPMSANATGVRQIQIVRYTAGVAQEVVGASAFPAGSSQQHWLTTSGLTLCAANDYVQIEVLQNSGAALDTLVFGNLVSQLSWQLVRAT